MIKPLNMYQTPYYVWFPGLGEREETAHEITTCEVPEHAAICVANTLPKDTNWPQNCCVIGPEFKEEKQFLIEQIQEPRLILRELVK